MTQHVWCHAGAVRGAARGYKTYFFPAQQVSAGVLLTRAEAPIPTGICCTKSSQTRSQVSYGALSEGGLA